MHYLNTHSFDSHNQPMSKSARSYYYYRPSSVWSTLEYSPRYFLVDARSTVLDGLARLSAQVIQNVVLASNKTSKRKQPPIEESSPENRPFEKAIPVNASKFSGQTPALKKQREGNDTTKSWKDKKMISSVLIEQSARGIFADVQG